MSRSRWLILAAALVVAIVGGWWLLSMRGEDRETARVERGSLDVTIETVGSVQATGATTIRSLRAGAIDTLGVSAGDVVAEGDIILLLDMAPFDRAVANSERDLEQAEYALQLAEQQADNDADNTSLRLEVLNAAQRVQRAEIALADAVESRRRAVVVSPRAGTILEVLVRTGDAISANQSVARIATLDDLTVVADVDELDLPNVAIGAEATFRLDAFPASELAGRVLSTGPQARQQGGATVFATEIAFDATDVLDIRPGMNADVTIVTAVRDDVLLIPDRALRTVGDRSFVIVETDGDSEEREITLGYRGGGLVEVVSGLSEGELVVLR